MNNTCRICIVLMAIVALTYAAGSGKPVDIKVQITGSKGKTVPLTVKLSDTVADVKKQIQKKEGIAPRSQQYVFEGQAMDDHRSLADYNIVKNSVLRLTVRAATP